MWVHCIGKTSWNHLNTLQGGQFPVYFGLRWRWYLKWLQTTPTTIQDRVAVYAPSNRASIAVADAQAVNNSTITTSAQSVV